MLDVFTEVVLPVLVVAGLGAAIGRWQRIPAQPLSKLVLYLLGPALVFSSLSRTQITADVGLRIVAVMIGTLVVMLIVALAWSRMRGHDAPMQAGFAMVATSPNFGNMGVAIATLAFGSLGLQVAIVTFVVGAILANTVGIAVGSTAAKVDWWRALATPLRYPYVYAAIAGVLVNALSIHVPMAISQPAAILAEAMIPVMLVVLGLQLKDGIGVSHLLDLTAVTSARLIVAPAVAWVIAGAIGLDGITRATIVTVAAMPAAVITTIFATQFDAKPAFVTQAVVVSTLLSMLTLTVLIDLIR